MDGINGMQDTGIEGQVSENILEGTPFKTPEEAAKGYLNLKQLHDTQANELGTSRKELEYLRGQNDTLNALLKERSGGGGEQEPPKESEYDIEIAAIEKQIQELDPMEDGYSKTLAALVTKSNQLTAKAQHEKTLGAASELFKRETAEQQAKAAKDSFLRDNPSFSAPETQARLREFLNNDMTGMHDPMSAYYKLSLDDAMSQIETFKAENEEMRELLDLDKGREMAGRTILTRSTTAGQQTNRPKLTDAELDAQMLKSIRDAGVD